MTDNPPPSANPTTPCPGCGWPVNDEILSDSPKCPHGWVSLEGMAIADARALFAAGAPELSLDPSGGTDA